MSLAIRVSPAHCRTWSAALAYSRTPRHTSAARRPRSPGLLRCSPRASRRISFITTRWASHAASWYGPEDAKPAAGRTSCTEASARYPVGCELVSLARDVVVQAERFVDDADGGS